MSGSVEEGERKQVSVEDIENEFILYKKSLGNKNSNAGLRLINMLSGGVAINNEVDRIKIEIIMKEINQINRVKKLLDMVGNIAGQPDPYKITEILIKGSLDYNKLREDYENKYNIQEEEATNRMADDFELLQKFLDRLDMVAKVGEVELKVEIASNEIPVEEVTKTLKKLSQNENANEYVKEVLDEILTKVNLKNADKAQLDDLKKVIGNKYENGNLNKEYLDFIKDKVPGLEEIIKDSKKIISSQEISSLSNKYRNYLIFKDGITNIGTKLQIEIKKDFRELTEKGVAGFDNELDKAIFDAIVDGMREDEEVKDWVENIDIEKNSYTEKNIEDSANAIKGMLNEIEKSPISSQMEFVIKILEKAKENGSYNKIEEETKKSIDTSLAKCCNNKDISDKYKGRIEKVIDKEDFVENILEAENAKLEAKELADKVYNYKYYNSTLQNGLGIEESKNLANLFKHFRDNVKSLKQEYVDDETKKYFSDILEYVEKNIPDIVKDLIEKENIPNEIDEDKISLKNDNTDEKDIANDAIVNENKGNIKREDSAYGSGEELNKQVEDKSEEELSGKLLDEQEVDITQSVAESNSEQIKGELNNKVNQSTITPAENAVEVNNDSNKIKKDEPEQTYDVITLAQDEINETKIETKIETVDSKLATIEEGNEIKQGERLRNAAKGLANAVADIRKSGNKEERISNDKNDGSEFENGRRKKREYALKIGYNPVRPFGYKQQMNKQTTEVLLEQIEKEVKESDVDKGAEDDKDEKKEKDDVDINKNDEITTPEVEDTKGDNKDRELSNDDSKEESISNEKEVVESNVDKGLENEDKKVLDVNNLNEIGDENNNKELSNDNQNKNTNYKYLFQGVVQAISSVSGSMVIDQLSKKPEIAVTAILGGLVLKKLQGKFSLKGQEKEGITKGDEFLDAEDIDIGDEFLDAEDIDIEDEFLDTITAEEPSKVMENTTDQVDENYEDYLRERRDEDYATAKDYENTNSILDNPNETKEDLDTITAEEPSKVMENTTDQVDENYEDYLRNRRDEDYATAKDYKNTNIILDNPKGTKTQDSLKENFNENSREVSIDDKTENLPRNERSKFNRSSIEQIKQDLNEAQEILEKNEAIVNNREETIEDKNINYQDKIHDYTMDRGENPWQIKCSEEKYKVDKKIVALNIVENFKKQLGGNMSGIKNFNIVYMASGQYRLQVDKGGKSAETYYIDKAKFLQEGAAYKFEAVKEESLREVINKESFKTSKLPKEIKRLETYSSSLEQLRDVMGKYSKVGDNVLRVRGNKADEVVKQGEKYIGDRGTKFKERENLVDNIGKEENIGEVMKYIKERNENKKRQMEDRGRGM